ncbi:hypothetical protein ACIBF1_07375 [Spirillospora sp. NPDC050679]
MSAVLSTKVSTAGPVNREDGGMTRWRSGDPATDAEIDAAYGKADRLRSRLVGVRAVTDAEKILSDARELGLQVLMATATRERRDAQDRIGPAMEEGATAFARARDRLTVALETEIIAADDLADHLEAVRSIALERVEAATELLVRLRRADQHATGLLQDAKDTKAAEDADRFNDDPPR